MKFLHFIWIITFISNFYDIDGVYTDCERPPSVHHGNAKLTEDDDGDMVTATYYCDNGFKLSGHITEIKCDLDTDEWKGDLPKCEEIEQSGGGSSSETENGGLGKRPRKQKGRQEIQEETNIDSTFASGLDLSCIGREIKRPPSIENAALVKYNRRKKNGNIFLVAFYECNDEYELEVPEHDRLYCSKEHWVGPEPVCTAVEYDENDNEDEDDYGDEDDEQYNEEDEDEENEDEEEDDEEENGEENADGNENEKKDHEENEGKIENGNGGKHEDDDDDDDNDKNDINEQKHHEKETSSGAVDAAAAVTTSTTERIVSNEINENKIHEHDVLSKSKVNGCELNRGGCDHECQVIQKPNDIDDGQIQCSCYTGFTLDLIDGKRCLDINECDNNNGGCEQTCNNTPGSFECTCTEGLQIDTINGKTCIDINECLLRNGHGPCQDTCFNTWSSYYCTCDGLPGTRLSTNMHDCEDAGTCSIKNGGCSHLCMTTYGRIHCLCDPGYILGDDWKTCKDINECNDPNINCPYECENTLGSYRCVNATTTVPEIESENRETNKIQEESENTGDTDEKDDDDQEEEEEDEDGDDDENKEDNAIIATNDNRLNIEKCEDGFEWNGHHNKCTDIDECALGHTGCEYCTNVEGGYECTCPDGYDLMDDEKHCQDINECEQYADYDENDSRESQSGSICSHECRNVPGSYECKCPENFHLQYDRRTCTRDFCDDLLNNLTNKTKCSHDCYDDSNGFVCKCPDQYELDSDFKTCIQKASVHIIQQQQQWCPLKHNPCAPGECINITSGYTCECPEGYTSAPDNNRCQDINECEESHQEHRHRCSHECRNTAGSYECSCPIGYELDEDEINCRAVSLCQHQNGGCSDICHYMHNTAVTCECYEGRRLSSDLRTCESKSFCDDHGGGGGGCQQLCLNEEQRCDCHAGYELDPTNEKLCNDIDECLVNNGGCHHHCYNTNGSFSCACAEGFKNKNDGEHQLCIDIDECAENRPCDHHCTNTDGSYKCTCQDGFQIGPDNHKCLDINECDLDNGNCSHICINLLGGFQCSCPHGQYLINDDSTCSFVNECEINNGGCSHECKYFEGTVFCNCPNGYELRNDDRKNCLDINECDFNNGDCSHTCENHIGHHTCRCNDGYQLGNDRRSCIDIDECIDDNGNCSNICVNLLGSHTCTCESGFELTADKRTCIDINECTEDIHDCSHECINIAGTYECSCPSGYRLGHDHFTCEDINECTQLTTACSDNCINTLGSYYCTCPIGHELDRNDNKTCIDINECDYDDMDDADDADETTNNEVNSYNNYKTKNIRRCSHDCQNTIGSFRCLCPIGLRLSENHFTCLDIDECTANDKHNVNGGCSQLCENFEGSYRCKCLPGYQLNGDHLTCSDIDECQQNNGDCEQICTNTNGSHHCGCHSDLILKSDGRHCQSTNPCHDNNGGCEHKCHWNGYVGGKAICSCNKGFKLNGDDNRSCNDIDECKLNTDKQYCPHTCTNTIGSYRCDCPRGHRLNDHNQCIDIDECQHLNGGCPRDSKCLNLVGGHRCLCSAGFKLSQDRRACVELRDNCKPIKSPRYGELRCTRSRHRTQLFYKTKCTVKCHKGYKLVGPSIKHCNGTGQWDDDGEPICVPQSCPRLPRPEKGVISPLNCMSGKIFAGERCILHCPVGYKPFNQQRTAVCNMEQNWIPNPNLYCIPIVEMTTPRTIIGAQVPPSASSSASAASLQTEKVFKPFIKCPQDTTIILPKNQRTVYIKLEQPKTNVDWWRYIDSHPAWGKQLQARLAPGEHIITFRARSPHSNVNVICRTIITVKESQPPQVVYCPQSIEYQLQPYEMSRAISWKEPVFRSSAHLKSIFKSKIPGNSLKPGIHQITYIATDLHNQTSKCEFTINIKRYAATVVPSGAAESTILAPKKGTQTTHTDGNNHHERTISQTSSSSGYSQVNQMENRLENHESYLMCPDKPALKIETNYPLHLPPGCYIKNVRIKQFNQHRRRHNITQNNMLKHYSSWDTGKNKRMLAFHSFHGHRGGGRGWL